MTPFGHIAISYISTCKLQNNLKVCFIIGSVFPDIDFLFILSGELNEMHRGLTHSFFFIFIISVILSFLLEKKNMTRCMFFFLGGILHIFIDSILDGNYSNGIGTQMFWPLSNEFYSPFNLLNDNSLFTWDKPLEFIKSNLGIILLIELPFYYLAYKIYRGK